MLYLGISETHQAQLKIIEALTRKFKLDPQIRLDLVAEQCPFNYTGADFYALCSDAMLKAMSRKAEEIDRKIGEFPLLVDPRPSSFAKLRFSRLQPSSTLNHRTQTDRRHC